LHRVPLLARTCSRAAVHEEHHYKSSA
jgi:hypothetical protein